LNTASRELLAVLRAQTAHSHQETLLMTYLVLWVASPEDPERKEALRWTRGLVGDQTITGEDLVRAWQALAQLEEGIEKQRALKNVVKLTNDPRLRLAMMANLASTAASEETRERELLSTLKLVDAAKDGSDHWRLGSILSQLSEFKLSRRDFAGARADAVRCLVARGKESSDDPDRRTCAAQLVATFEELGTLGNDSIPLASLGPVALSLMEAHLARFDRDQARHVGELLIDRYPEALEAAAVLDFLIALTRARCDTSDLVNAYKCEEPPT
jgi:hypothetical protein